MKKIANIKVYNWHNSFISLFETAFKIMKNGIYFIVAELFYAY